MSCHTEQGRRKEGGNSTTVLFPPCESITPKPEAWGMTKIRSGYWSHQVLGGGEKKASKEDAREERKVGHDETPGLLGWGGGGEICI